MSDIVILPVSGIKLEYPSDTVDENLITRIKLFPLGSMLYKRNKKWLYCENKGRANEYKKGR